MKKKEQKNLIYFHFRTDTLVTYLYAYDKDLISNIYFSQQFECTNVY